MSDIEAAMITTYGSLCAEVYDITKPIGGQYPDVPYYIRHLSKIGGRILEPAVDEDSSKCGTIQS